MIGQYPFVGGVKTPSAVGNHPQDTTILFSLNQRVEGKVVPALSMDSGSSCQPWGLTGTLP